MIVIIGVGAIGLALAEGLLRNGNCSSHELLLIDRDTLAAAGSPELSGCRVATRIPHDITLQPGDVVFLAVKPQDSAEVFHSVGPALASDVLVVSVMAGVSIDHLAAKLGHSKVVRAMPNLGAVVRRSATVFCVSQDLDAGEIEQAELLLRSFGRTWRVAEERFVDVATAIAGSGPAYLCWLLEQMQVVATELGLSPRDAHELVYETLAGTAEYLAGSSDSFADLRSRVTSPAGTTAAAIAVLEQRDVASSVQEAFRAAFERALELGNAR